MGSRVELSGHRPRAAYRSMSPAWIYLIISSSNVDTPVDSVSLASWVTKNSIIADILYSNFKNSIQRMVLNVIGHTNLLKLVISRYSETTREIPNEIVRFGLHDAHQEATKSRGCNLCQLTK